MRIGYAGVSTDDQTLDLQRDALKRAKCRQIYEEHASGKTTVRPELDACLKSLRKGDTLIVWRLDRFGRSLGDLIYLTTDLRCRGVDFESLTEKIGDASSSASRAPLRQYVCREIECQASAWILVRYCSTPRAFYWTLVKQSLTSGKETAPESATASRCRGFSYVCCSLLEKYRIKPEWTL